jgi:hypothetical protein
MFHPLEEDLSLLKDSEVEEKLRDLSRKYHLAMRLGNTEVLTQISTFVTIYRTELSKRLLTKTQSNNDNDLDQLINVD